MIAARLHAEHDADGTYLTYLDGLPLAAEGESWQEASTALAADLRRYSEAWSDRLFDAPNHAGNAPLVAEISQLSDIELRALLWARAETLALADAPPLEWAKAVLRCTFGTLAAALCVPEAVYDDDWMDDVAAAMVAETQRLLECGAF